MFLVASWYQIEIIIQLSERIFPQAEHRFKHLLTMIPLHFISIYLYAYFYSYLLEFIGILEDTHHRSSLTFIISLIGALFIATLYQGIRFITNWKQYVIRSEQLEKENLVAKYETLKKQVHPHFLLNGLNTLISLIENNEKTASEYAQNLSDFLRFLLTQQSKELITLKEELEIVSQYAYIQQIRFNNNVSIKLNVPEEFLNKKLPPLAVQMLVENAIKHNIISNKKPLNIHIGLSGEKLLVVNNLQKKQQVSSTEIGLNNIDKRYKFISDQRPEIVTNENEFKVKLPLIQ